MQQASVAGAGDGPAGDEPAGRLVIVANTFELLNIN